ncbi:MAG TPA: Hsp20/alpha crystallin family protein [Polyangiaceae bacterium]|nr:Hsp20/alpha crystallin family protein [Polyangiaceae bacterium]
MARRTSGAKRGAALRGRRQAAPGIGPDLVRGGAPAARRHLGRALLAPLLWPSVFARRFFSEVFGLPVDFDLDPHCFSVAALSRLGCEAGAPAPAPWSPRFEATAGEGGLVVRAILPGFRRDDVSVYLEEGSLVIEGARSRPREGGAPARGAFRRVMCLPRGVDAEAVEASFGAGVLRVRVLAPAPGAGRHAIEIRGEDEAPPGYDAGARVSGRAPG